jgi:hypothetical protein
MRILMTAAALGLAAPVAGCAALGDVAYRAAGKAGCDNLPYQQAIECRIEVDRKNEQAKARREGRPARM